MSEPAAKPVQSQSGFGTWIDHHAYSVVSGLGRLLRRPWATALTIGVMAVALALPLGLLLVLDNVGRLSGSVQQSQEISVFLAMDTSTERTQALEREIAARADVATVELRTPEQGLEELRSRGGLGDAIDGLGGLDANPLPAVLVVVPARDDAALAAALGALPEAELVVHDAAWRQRLDAWMRFAARVAWVLAALLGIGALLVVGNTVRLDIQSRRDEIGVLQLLGATDGFIRRPFLYQGAWYGLAAGALALGLLALAGLALQAPLAELVAGYGSGFALRGFGIAQSLAVVAGAALLGWLGAGVVTGHYLRQTRPTDA
ncbi:permease-like cell division protein FtsX [Luteimonas sp. YGD11-2]|uniref:permease-like cell division protein FtsX n=1 Tax=Luteimonas sp. YGD11-2 TaxID=2508168 RepID=UPI00100BCF22|nr:permease-like cell division protein FtsX [Luteimonas sp. YGD11-2]